MTDSSKTILDRLRALKSECGPDKNDQATVLICACILEGLDTAKRIVGALSAIGMNAKHVKIRLTKKAKSSAGRYWQCDDEGRYSLTDNPALG